MSSCERVTLIGFDLFQDDPPQSATEATLDQSHNRN